MIAFKKLTVHPPGCPTAILSDIDLTIGSGITCIIGPSGAGKSTLLRCINGLTTPTGGSVSIGGQNITHADKTCCQHIRRHIGMIFQHCQLLTHASVLDNILIPHRLGHPYPKDLPAWLEKTGLTALQHHRPHQLSGGQKQRVAIVRALAYGPKLLLCDEPTSALDPDTTTATMQLLHQLHKTYNIPMVMVCHDLTLVKQWADDVVILDAGRVVEHQSLQNMLKKPQSSLSQNWLAHQQLPPLPTAIQHACQDQTLLHLHFHGGNTLSPLLANFHTLFDVETSILQAQVDCVQDQIMGTMTIALTQPHPPLATLIDYWQSHTVLARPLTPTKEPKDD